MKECLQLLIKNLRHLQHELDSALRTEQFILNKLITACQDVRACQYVCFRLSNTLARLINDLRSSIFIYQKTHFVETTFFFDRHHHKNYRLRNQDRDIQDRKVHKQISQYVFNEDDPGPDPNDEIKALMIEFPSSY
jgi:precorrin isomerase